MKKWLIICMALMLSLVMTACGSSSQNNGIEEEKKQDISSEEQNEENKEEYNIDTLPMNINETYRCTLDGVDGYIRVTEYEIIPDEMNEGCEGRNVYIDAVFYDAPADFDLSAVVFVVDGSVEVFDEGMWMITDELGNQDVIIDYGNEELYSTYENGVYAESILVSYMVPNSYDELALSLVAGNPKTSLENVSKEDVLSLDSCWFLMGSLNDGVLSYNNEAVATLKSNANESDMYAYRTTVADQKENSYNDEENIQPNFDKKLKLIDFNAVMRDECEGRILEFQSIKLIDYSEEYCTFEVVVNYSGSEEGDKLVSMLFDAYNEIHVDLQEYIVKGSGTVTATFTGRTENAPFTFTAGVYPKDDELFNCGIHVDGEIE